MGGKKEGWGSRFCPSSLSRSSLLDLIRDNKTKEEKEEEVDLVPKTLRHRRRIPEEEEEERRDIITFLERKNRKE